MNSRKTVTMVIAGATLIVACIIVTSMLLATKPSIIQINDGTFKILELPYAYTKNEAYILVFFSAFGGMMLSYILAAFFTAGRAGSTIGDRLKEIPVYPADAPDAHPESKSPLIEAVLTALEGDEKKLIKEISDHGGEMLQNELVLSLNFSKAKVSRMVSDLEKRGMLVKKQYGLTNKVALAGKIRGEKNEK